MSELHDQLAFAIAAAQEAGRITLGHFRTDLAVEAKDDLSPVTVADRQAEQRIRERIESVYPDHAVVGEEFGTSGANAATHRWIVDPIDGTRAFTRGVPLYSVLLALEIEGTIEVGVVHFPALGETLWAARGEGCYLNGSRCRVRSTTRLEEAFVGFTNASSFEEHGRGEAWRRISSACAYSAGWSDAYGHALVASGRLELMLDPVMNLWDCAPFGVILEEAGGYFGDWSGQRTVHGGEAISTTPDLLGPVLALIGNRAAAGTERS